MKHLLLVSSFFTFFSVSALAQPVITQNPQNAAACVDSCAYFSVSAVGNGLNYQWRMEDGAGGFTVVGNQQNLELCDSVLQFDGFSFYCAVFDNNGDSAISNMAALEVDSCLPPVADFYWDWSLAEICFTSTSVNAESVFWLFGDGTTNANNDTSVCHTYATNELYFVKLIAFNAYGQTEVEKSLNLLSIDNVESFYTMFPNPTSDNFSLKSDKVIESIAIYDLKGSLISVEQPQSKNVEMSISSLESGLYNVVITIDGDLVHERLIKK